jgi:hypothetical protein
MNLPVEVVEATRQGRCVLALGTHASLEAARMAERPWPTERDVALALGLAPPRRLPGVRTQADQPSVAHLAQTFQARYGRDTLLSELQRQLSGHGLEPSAAHFFALERFPLVLTTAWDDLLDRAAPRISRPVRFVERLQALPELASEQTVVLRLRGSFAHPDTLLLTSEDWERRARPWELSRQLREIIGSNVLLFVGFRPDDEEFELLWSELLEIYGGELPRCHLALGQGPMNDLLWQKWVWRGLLLFTADAAECLSELVRSVTG